MDWLDNPKTQEKLRELQELLSNSERSLLSIDLIAEHHTAVRLQGTISGIQSALTLLQEKKDDRAN